MGAVRERSGVGCIEMTVPEWRGYNGIRSKNGKN